ncbi:MAG: PCRF domain-containing protein [Patescibacteria group bacterium]|nr:PCRF domain-containing protein [Patescibacteria group bacterium]
MPNDYFQAELDRLDQKIKEAQASLADPQLKPLAEEEITKLSTQKKLLTASQNIPFRNVIPLRNGIKFGNIILEIRPGTGGEEARIFASDLENMYTRFALSQKLEVIPLEENIIKIKGKKAYDLFQYEAGGHRVQRVPTTESQGRIHTSTATVAVLPEVKETDIHLNPKDIEVHFFHASSHGGQNVQKVSTAVRLTHKPTGIVTTCQSQRFQEQNRKIATDLLRAKLYQLDQDKIASQIYTARQSAGTGMRAEKIRTYNFPQNRVTDHRIKKSWKILDRIINGDLLPVIKSLLSQRPLPT